MIIFGICFLMIYLILSALYESFIIPFAVLLRACTAVSCTALIASPVLYPSAGIAFTAMELYILKLMIYLILSALYESFIIPFAVLLSVPCGLMGSFLCRHRIHGDGIVHIETAQRLCAVAACQRYELAQRSHLSDHLWYLLPDDLSDSECIVRELYHSVRRASECALRIGLFPVRP